MTSELAAMRPSRSPLHLGYFCAMTLVVKLGSSIVAADDGECASCVLDSVCEQVARWRRAGSGW